MLADVVHVKESLSHVYMMQVGLCKSTCSNVRADVSLKSHQVNDAISQERIAWKVQQAKL
jgi:hypothetical protein